MLFITFSIVTILLMILYFNRKYTESYWKKRGVPYDSTNKYIGPMFEFLYSKLSVYEIFQRVYQSQPDAPAIGLASFLQPTLLIKDQTNIQHMLASDFNSFHHRGIEPNEGDILADNILFMNGNRWKLIRQHMTPLFTSTKLKSMYYIMDKSAKDFVKYLDQNPQYLRGNAFNTISTFCSAAIGAAVFGIGAMSVFDSPFLKMAQVANKTTLKVKLAFAANSVSPGLFKFLGFHIFKQHESFFIDAIKQIIRAREQENVKRHDFADVCVSLQQKGTLKDSDTGLEIEPTDEVLAAQAFFFFLAGVEPSATGLFNTLVELGRHPEVLKKVHEEIDMTFQNHTEVSYDVLFDMQYIDQVVNEALRLHPPVSNIFRQCVNDAVLPVGNIKIDKGTKIFIPIYQLHHDTKYFPDPEEFKPERFSKENKHKINGTAYMPFGNGNRICLGKRFALLQIKAGLVHLLRNYSVKLISEDDKIIYNKDLIQLRISNTDVEFITRNTDVVA